MTDGETTSHGRIVDHGSIRPGKIKCDFPGCGWTETFMPDESGAGRAEDRIKRHFERDHAGTVKLQVTLELEQALMPDQDPADLRTHWLDHWQDEETGSWEVCHVRSEVVEEPDEAFSRTVERAHDAMDDPAQQDLEGNVAGESRSNTEGSDAE